MLPLAQRQQPRCQQPRCRGDAVLERLPVQIPCASAVLGMRQDQGLDAALLQNPHLPRGQAGLLLTSCRECVCPEEPGLAVCSP